MIKRLLIANRGEIALRIIRACQQLGIETVAIYAKDDDDSLHCRLADQAVCIGPAGAQSYMNPTAILSACNISGADAVHPGYGFLSENAEFAKSVNQQKLTFIGPSSHIIDAMGNKINAIKLMKKYGLKTIPGSMGTLPQSTQEQAAIAKNIGYPVLLKAASGGGGKGMKVVQNPDSLHESIRQIQSESLTTWGNDDVYMEKYLSKPRHIEVQILADAHGQVICLGDRDCSVQRRHQKIIEEAPAIGIPESLREQLYATCRRAMQKIGYIGVGTIELLYDNKQFYFIEMNTRIQVEHPVTEMCTGIDLIAEQIAAHNGHKLTISQSQVLPRGHAIECRINAEDPETMNPCPGRLECVHFPGGPGVRVDSHVYTGYQVSHHYDSLIAKIIVHAPSREKAILAMTQALRETHLAGIKTNIKLHQKILQSPEFYAGHLHIHILNSIHTASQKINAMAAT